MDSDKPEVWKCELCLQSFYLTPELMRREKRHHGRGYGQCFFNPAHPEPEDLVRRGQPPITKKAKAHPTFSLRRLVKEGENVGKGSGHWHLHQWDVYRVASTREGYELFARCEVCKDEETAKVPFSPEETEP